MIDTLPRSLCKSLLDFCEAISPEKPVFIRSKPFADAVQGHCFDNVQEKIRRTGGSVAYGWAIWHLRGAYFEAEHHGVWRKENGDLVDVSPQLNGYRKILFLPDQEAIYSPTEFRPNVIEAEKGNPFADELVAACLRRNAILDKYRGQGVLAAYLSPSDQLEHDVLLNRIQALLLHFALCT